VSEEESLLRPIQAMLVMTPNATIMELRSLKVCTCCDKQLQLKSGPIKVAVNKGAFEELTRAYRVYAVIN
jgi:hypothetical protein